MHPGTKSSLYRKFDPDYSLLDLSWNIKPSAARKSYRFVVFDSKANSDTFLRERYVYQKTESEPNGTGTPHEKEQIGEKGPAEKGPVGAGVEFSLLKVPIKQLFANIDERKREQEKAERAEKAAEMGKSGKMDIEFSSSSRVDQASTGHRRKRITEEYLPKDFTDLIGSDKTNRFALKWLKSWDSKVFKRKLPVKPQMTPDKVEVQPYNPYFKKKPQKFNYDLQYQFENLSLTTEKDVKELNSKMLLLSGNSGTGKTTLATTIAKKCGYNPFKVALSSFRSLFLTKLTWTVS